MDKRTSAALGLSLLTIFFGMLLFGLHQRFRSAYLPPGTRLPEVKLRHMEGPDTLLQPGNRMFILYRKSCEHCQETIASLIKIKGLHPDWFQGAKGLHIILVNEAESTAPDPIAKLIPMAGLYVDDRKALMTALGGGSVPLILVVGDGDVIRDFHTGELGDRAIEKLIKPYVVFTIK